MEVKRDAKGEIPFIRFHGDITIPDVFFLKELFNDLIKEGKFNVVLDLRKVSTIDRTGIGAFVAGYTTLRNHNGSLKLLSPSPSIRSSLRAAGVSRFFEIFEDEFEILFSFQS